MICYKCGKTIPAGTTYAIVEFPDGMQAVHTYCYLELKRKGEVA